MTATALSSERITLTPSDGTTMEAYVSRPNGVTNGPGLLVFQEAFGVNAHIRDVADRFASLGFTAIAPELFHRTAGNGFDGAYTDFPTVMPHLEALTVEGLQADIRAAYDFLQRDAQVDKARIAATGYCMGGRTAYVANATVKLAAAISYYGGRIAPDLLPLAASQQAPILMFWGGLDEHIPAEQYRAVADALTAARKVHEQVIFGQADHAFFCDARASYNKDAATQAWALTLEFLKVYGVL